MQKFRWAFFSYGHNMGDFTRALETAKAMTSLGHAVHFYNHGSVFTNELATGNIQCINLEPELTWEQHKAIMDINRYKAAVGTPIPVDKQQWIAMAEADIAALSEYKPDGVYAGMNLSCMISVPYMKLPMVTQPPTVNCPSFITSGMYEMPNTMEKNFVTRYLLPDRLKRKIMAKVLLGNSAKQTLTSFNEARKYFGLPPIYNIVSLFKGDLTLLPDLPELSGLAREKLTVGYYYTGPIFAMLDMPCPKEADQVFSQPGTNVFCSLGSSGFPETLKQIVSWLKEINGINLVVSTTTIISPEELGANTKNFYATRYLPSHLVTEKADIAVIHGGQGTVQSTVWAGTPFIGIGFQAEQQANINGLVKAGSARRIPLFELSSKRIKKELSEVTKESYKINAKQLQQLVRKTDGAKISADYMNKFLEAAL